MAGTKGSFFVCFSILFAVRPFPTGTRRPHQKQPRRLKEAAKRQSTGRCESRDKIGGKKCVIFYFPSFSYRKMSVLVFRRHFKRAPKRHPKSTPELPQKYPLSGRKARTEHSRSTPEAPQKHPRSSQQGPPKGIFWRCEKGSFSFVFEYFLQFGRSQ